jgi:hypothetical protein
MGDCKATSHEDEPLTKRWLTSWSPLTGGFGDFTGDSPTTDGHGSTMNNSSKGTKTVAVVQPELCGIGTGISVNPILPSVSS